MKRTLIILSLLIAGFSTSGQANEAIVAGNIIKMQTNDGTQYGGCMVALDEALADNSLDCLDNWVTFSCTGDFTSKDDAYRMFDFAQLAYAMDKKVEISVDDLRKHDGYCFGYEIIIR